MGSEAVKLFYQIPKSIDLESTDHFYVSLLNACSHSKLTDEARTIFSQIVKKQKRMYTVMVG